MPLIDPNETIRVDLPAAGEWVDVQARLSAGDVAEITRRTMAGVMVGAEQGQGQDLKVPAGEVVVAMAFTRLELVIRAWSFDAPVTPENIRRLDTDSQEFLDKRLDVMYGERTKDELVPLGVNGSAP